ncbi:MAG: tRNA (N(6)-L-threonylcarbamoyladenosine(37)-C(2))-methylthiotransferase MtaB [Melioribacteraceae bacterium]|nr:tRNA (N(6)-L-threonylcarbamoyladenosine(37)-C(2))-methylthiotransferase MtaB [Melioribacteraceae bacterium]MCF8355657.1 tRNA (N(6)-L-threonylcarbamoyladenosine(37)-C(2))-methylthiotransferase MtaB [Melioribacteraceae bacterium]MCF8395141.1 tRNA (N(6)-L-threonylcarbamoyladenosine(37)-C(2))-methylthiotransferase MtaB [Melioribacteraceae bacterium]MCF8420565.1 tRNA (N(6)-L-threonylcarbamoyladenosine(37)-C(2))-methylthiotransferase MtaB [Melioribacteraceae bacterium]
MSSKVALHTLGCKLNFSETSAIGNEFLKNGFDIVDFNESADVYVINTCTVTENADRECRQIVRRALRKNPDAFVAVTGCYAQLRPDEISKIKGVDAVLGSEEKFRIFEIFNEFEKSEFSCIHVTPTNELKDFNYASSTDADDRTRAFFKIQDGCDYKCTFCTIPLARGKSRSMEPERVISEFKKLLAEGYKEIILTGVNVGDYESTDGSNLYQLLLGILKVEGDYRLRISSIEPNLLNNDIIKLTAEDSRMCNHFHIPLQSGSTKILKLMQRRYKAEDYKSLIYNAVSKIPDLGIGVDVITGFPGETDEDFLDTYNFLKELPISYLHVFTYSERPNTKAIEMNDHVDKAIRKKRTNMLRILSEKKRIEFNRRMLNKNATVLFEHTNHDGLMKGFASNYVRVSAPYEAEKINTFSEVTLKEVAGRECFAQMRSNKNQIKTLAG